MVNTKLTQAQQIAKLEEEMDNEERNAYVTIWVQACPDQLFTSYDYGTKVCHSILVMDSCISQR